MFELLKGDALVEADSHILAILDELGNKSKKLFPYLHSYGQKKPCHNLDF